MLSRFVSAALLTPIGLLLAAADEPAKPDYPEPPPVIAERIVDGRFEQGNFEYLRGFFPEASEAEKADYAAMSDWLNRCSAEGRAKLDQELSELGVSLVEGELMGAANICQQVILGDRFEDFASYDELEGAARGARLVFNTLVSSVENIDRKFSSLTIEEMGAKLHAMTLGEQLLRMALHWGWVEQIDARRPSLSDKERVVFLALLNSEILRVDHRNTEWLKSHVAEQGWPTISKVGERGSSAAWLLTQHADLNPTFQLRALRLMEPLVAEGEVSKRNYAYLYDRVMLKLAGKQRYATQVTCDAGDYVPRTLEEPERMDELRAEMDLNTFAEYRRNFPETC